MNARLFLLLVTVVGVLFVLSSRVMAQESDQEMAKKYNISFPIVELGNCADISACKTYCDDQSHRDVCIAFAKKKGFHKETAGNDRREKLVEAARATLGCTSEAECRSFCQEQKNFEKCRKFAQDQGFDSHPQNPREDEMRKKAKEVLGCESMEQCRAFCEQESNREKCQSFARSAGLSRSDENPNEGPKNQRKGPGGCDSKESCEAYCKDPAHAKECGRSGEEMNRGIPQDEARDQKMDDSRYQNEQGRMNPEEFCKANPEKCQQGQGIPQDTMQEYRRGMPQQQQNDQMMQYNRPSQNGDPTQYMQSTQQRGAQPQGDQRASEYQKYPENQRPPEYQKSSEYQRPSEYQKPPEGQSPSEFQRPPEGMQQGSSTEFSQQSTMQPEVKGVSNENSLMNKIRSFFQRFGL